MGQMDPNRRRKEYQKMATRLKEAEEAISRHDRNTEAQLARQAETLKLQFGVTERELKSQVAALQADLDNTKHKLDLAKEATDEQRGRADALDVKLQTNQANLDYTLDQLKTVEGQLATVEARFAPAIAELQERFTRVEGKVKAKEREAISAGLNRLAMARAVPGHR